MNIVLKNKDKRKRPESRKGSEGHQKPSLDQRVIPRLKKGAFLRVLVFLARNVLMRRNFFSREAFAGAVSGSQPFTQEIEMKNNLMILCGTAAVLCMVTACETSPTSKPPGEYKSTHKTTNSSGTTVKSTEKTKVYYDEYGNKRAVKETETTKDPKGLFNKSTTSSTKTYN